MAETNDIHAIALRGLARRQEIDVKIIDLKDIPQSHRLLIVPGDATEFIGEDARIRIREYAGVWWRRPRTPRIPLALQNAEQSIRDFCVRETQAAMAGLFYAYTGNIVNDPLYERAAANKVLQLEKARQCGLAIPRTCITNDPRQARTFIDSLNGDVVYKILTNTPFQFTPTRLVDKRILSQIESVQLCPVILQERIAGTEDLRVTVVDRNVFPARVRGVEGLLDWREVVETKVETTTVDAAETEKLLALMRHLNLRYGAVDYRLASDGTLVFFEINPAAQYLFVELATGQPITQALINALTCPAE